MSDRSVVAIFDFDKTLVRKDSFRIFSITAAGNLKERLIVLWLAILCKIGWISNDVYKSRVLECVWISKKPNEREVFLTEFCSDLHQIENMPVVSRLKDHLAKAHCVAIVSASPEFYLKPFINSWATNIAVFGSTVEFVGDRALLDNLYGEFKSEKARLLIKQHQPDDLVVYTDHASDLPMIKLATEVWLISPSRNLERTLRMRGVDYQVLKL